MPRGDIDPVYFDSPYYLYPDGPIAVETLRVIGAAMAQTGVVGLGRLTLSRRERMVMVEPRDTGMALFTLRAAGGSSGTTIWQRRGRSRCRDGGNRGCDHQAADRQFRPEHLPRPLSGGAAAADRGEDERTDHQAPGHVNTIAGDRFNGRPETQPCAGTICPGAKNGKKEANQKGTRSTSAGIALALNRGSQKKSTALGRPGCH